MNDKEKLKKLEKAIRIGTNALFPPKIMTTCPFCFAKLIGTDIPKKCPHCNTKFKDDDDLQLIEKNDSPYGPSGIKPDIWNQ